jgi:molecular chaperone HscB
MTPDPIPVRSASTLECRSCGAGAPVDEHFCPNCSRILALGRHGDYFAFFGLPRKLTVDPQDLERRFRELSRKFHPDYYYNATPAERLASLERSSYLNDAYRALRHPVSRIEHLLAIEGLPGVSPEEHPAGSGAGKVPAALLEEVFALNEELDEIREAREAGTAAAALRARLASARAPIERKRQEHQRQLDALAAQWDALADGSPERQATLHALRERLLERNYINNLLATIDREQQAFADSDGAAAAADSAEPPAPADSRSVAASADARSAGASSAAEPLGSAAADAGTRPADAK